MASPFPEHDPRTAAATPYYISVLAEQVSQFRGSGESDGPPDIEFLRFVPGDLQKVLNHCEVIVSELGYSSALIEAAEAEPDCLEDFPSDFWVKDEPASDSVIERSVAIFKPVVPSDFYEVRLIARLLPGAEAWVGSLVISRIDNKDPGLENFYTNIFKKISGKIY